MKKLSTQKAFTLIEMLVVLIITSVTTSLLISSLSTTWTSFEKLGARDLRNNQLQFPKHWFIESVNTALHGHPDLPTFSGSDKAFTFISYKRPNNVDAGPGQLSWQLNPAENGLFLIFQSGGETSAPLLELGRSAKFKYLSAGRWEETFKPTKGMLPKAVGIFEDERLVLLAVVQRKEKPDIPPEIPVFGAYEF